MSPRAAFVAKALRRRSPSPKASAPLLLKGRRVLVLRHDHIGDLVMALPLLDALKASGAFVGLLAAKATVPLLRQDPRVDLLLTDGPEVLGNLRRSAFDTALVLWASRRNAWLVRRSGIPERLGPSWRPYSGLFTRRLSLRRGQGWTREGELNLEFGRALGCPADFSPPPRLFLPASARVQAKAWLKKNGPPGSGPLVLLHPGSGGSAQPWPAERFAALGLELKHRYGARLLVTGGPQDHE
ncbi:MAG: glycosyltransferase family 9 protein, partial [bacterium]